MQAFCSVFTAWKCTVSLFYALSMNYGLAKHIENFDCFLPLKLYMCAFSQIDVFFSDVISVTPQGKDSLENWLCIVQRDGSFPYLLHLNEMTISMSIVTSMPLKCPIHVHYASFFVMCHFLSCRTKSCDKGSTIELTPTLMFWDLESFISERKGQTRVTEQVKKRVKQGSLNAICVAICNSASPYASLVWRLIMTFHLIIKLSQESRDCG